MARRLKTIARYINEHCAPLQARIEQGYCDTDRHLFAHICHAGKGRWGNRLIVVDTSKPTTRGPEVVLDHNAAETYRCNDEVERWLSQWESEHRRPKRRRGA